MYLFGASGHGKVIAEIAELLKIKIQGFVDANTNIKTLLDYEVSHKIPENAKNIIISIGNNNTRKKIYETHTKYTYPILIHPNSNVSHRAQLDIGSVVMAGSTINSETKIGKHCIINTNASIDHDCIIEDFVHISPNAALAGSVYVSEGTHIGIGASVIQGLKIGKWATIGAGAVIIKDVPDYAVVVGNPARIIKFQQK
ncbi:acetyltransferase [Moheibacter sediminis]|uniref:Acetyltransferase EpsM n=1 Tax=Moheibacter sediminis TaxID=1434700 RepID=A0A1W2BAM9_9FLAO|nr:acetyltransferase [Moheibacter sediminis]SMC69969.1 acetyltransferase EpsM [Moheibacter sediminis]